MSLRDRSLATFKYAFARANASGIARGRARSGPRSVATTACRLESAIQLVGNLRYEKEQIAAPLDYGRQTARQNPIGASVATELVMSRVFPTRAFVETVVQSIGLLKLVADWMK